ncbi:hypothetical protein TNCV_1285831 [Trichonephila clavipes]|uniref:Uncharacterized protein n=1 Tax=Trichonephila clavipes TaxID=2585209 RepID=A0A8X6VP90_TRICX|nr:hypothetical protein TNCV_1285831 [Trichonephila clavipes]
MSSNIRWRMKRALCVSNQYKARPTTPAVISTRDVSQMMRELSNMHVAYGAAGESIRRARHVNENQYPDGRMD